MRTSGIVLFINTKVLQEATFDLFYLVLRDHFFVRKSHRRISQIMFFENLIMPVIINDNYY